MLALDFLSPFNFYDATTLGCVEFFAGEYWRGHPDFAGGQGPGLFSRKVGQGTTPAPVAGSAARRIYALTTFTRDDGAVLLVGLGMKTADIFVDSNYPAPQAWALRPPDPLYVFTSPDGVTWNEFPLGSIERGGGPIGIERAVPNSENGVLAFTDNSGSIGESLMQSNTRWIRVTDNNRDVLWITSGTHLIEFDGYHPTALKLDRRVDSAVNVAGRFYMGEGNQANVVREGQTILRASGSGAIEFTKRVALQGDGLYNYIGARGGGQVFTTSNGRPVGVGRVRGRWVFHGRVNSPDTQQKFVSWILPTLPDSDSDLEFDLSRMPPAVISDAAHFFQLDGNGGMGESTSVRASGARCYLSQRGDMQDRDYATLQRQAVFVTIVDPTISDFWIDAAVVVDGTPHLGTHDGYVLAYDPLAGRVVVLAKLDGPVRKMGTACGGQVFALTSTGLWWAEGGVSFTKTATPPTGYNYSDFVLTSDNRLLLISSNNTDSRVDVYTICTSEPQLVKTDAYAGLIMTVGIEFGSVWILSNSANGTVLVYDASNAATTSLIGQLGGENVRALAVGAGLLWVGTQAGTLLSTDGATWTVRQSVGHPIIDLEVVGGIVYIAVGGSTGTYYTFNPTTSVLTSVPLPHGNGHVIVGWNGKVLIGGECFGIVAVPDNNETNAARLVTTVLELDTTAREVFLLPVTEAGIVGESGDGWTLRVRSEPSDSAVNDLSSYQLAAAARWTTLNTASKQVRVVVTTAAGQQFGALGVLCHAAEAE